MAAVAITTSNTNALLSGDVYRSSARRIVRTSSGLLYALVWRNVTTPNDVVDMYKSSDGSSWALQATKGAGSDTIDSRQAQAIAIDGSGVIQFSIAYSNNNNYSTYTVSSDTFGSTTTPSAPGGDSHGGNVIAIDSAGKVHSAYTDTVKDMGVNYSTLYYANNIGGSWSTVLQVEGATANKNVGNVSITLDANDVPIISYRNATDGQLTLALGNANNATSFTLHDVDTTSITNEPTSVGVDSGGIVWVAYVHSNNVYLCSQTDGYTPSTGSGWTTWNTPITNSNATGGTGVSLAINGTDVYVFYEENNSDIAYDKYTGSWAGEVVLETGTFNNVRVKWARFFDYDSTGADRGGGGSRVELDYVFVDETATPDVWWNKLTLSAPPAGRRRSLVGITGE